MSETKEINFKLDIRPDIPFNGQHKLGGLHQSYAQAEVEGHEVMVSGGFGCGHSEVYVFIDGKRILSADSAPFLHALIKAAIEIHNANPNL